MVVYARPFPLCTPRAWQGNRKQGMLQVGIMHPLFILKIHYEIMSHHPHLVYGTAFIVLLVLVCLAAGCSSGQSPPATASPATPAAATAAPAGNSISIKNFAFDPPALTVKAGSAVAWVNNDVSPHAIVSDPGSPVSFSSDTLSTGASFSFTFNTPGTYPYHCSIHPSMKGTIIVQ